VFYEFVGKRVSGEILILALIYALNSCQDGGIEKDLNGNGLSKVYRKGGGKKSFSVIDDKNLENFLKK